MLNDKINMKTETKSKTRKRSSRRLHGVASVPAYAWQCDFGLCRWAEPNKRQLTDRNKPSPEAVPIRVRIITLKDFQKLKAH